MTSVLDALGAKAAAMVPDGAVVGLGSGRAAEAFLRALAERARSGLRVHGVATSNATAQLAGRLGVRLVPLPDEPLALTVDGADEVDPRLDLIKGYGGALVRERIVAAASRQQVILVGEEKLVPALGSRGRLPIEVIPMAVPLVRRRLEALGLLTALRRGADGLDYVTDNGGRILDATIGPLSDPRGLEQAIRAVPGVVDTGLFLGTADLVLVGGPDGIRELRRA
ncbi:MAG TPA: ribose-5-phosphate isomerase RpiA [Thermodesulfobacteriota bacterium]